jgi:hypothetical protein
MHIHIYFKKFVMSQSHEQGSEERISDEENEFFQEVIYYIYKINIKSFIGTDAEEKNSEKRVKQ